MDKSLGVYELNHKCAVLEYQVLNQTNNSETTILNQTNNSETTILNQTNNSETTI